MIEDKELDKLLDDVKDILMPSALEKLSEYFGRIYQKVQELRDSRDKWREKYEELKAK